MEPIRIVVADPHDVVRAALTNLLGKEPDLEVVGTTADGVEALRLAQRLAPDVLLLEALIAEPPALEIVRCLKAGDGPTRVLALSRCERRWMIRQMLEQGAHGYFLKKDNPADVLEALRRIAAGEDGLLSTAVAQRLFSRDAGDLERARRRLTEREWEVMQLVAQGLSNRELAERLFISAGTARNHVSHVLSKLSLSSRSKLIVWAHQHDLPAPPRNERGSSRSAEPVTNVTRLAWFPAWANHEPSLSKKMRFAS